ncbi:hypothetical protein NM688_g7263 [Phlebia brevispora]|uniref:Uncharacterized protein n=1 Tax=Phlebia brevispora TaxID=194682 RepID=A0ACC1S7U0_9APHY|nr:hypothetical protein NM688_g7263 [Phlebia brevispora]
MLRKLAPLLTTSRPTVLRTKPLLYAPCLARHYAYSRFDERRPGSSRSRDRPERVSPKRQHETPGSTDTEPESPLTYRDVQWGPFTFRVQERRSTNTEEKPPFEQPFSRPSQDAQFSSRPEEPQYSSRPEQETSPLWEASRRPPASDPKEGLRRLLMDNDLLIVTRQIEMLNIFAGFEQSNRYVISNENEEVLGYIAEEPRGILSMFSRQLFRTHRPFRALVMDSAGSPILWLRRPFAWINSRMFVQRLKDYEKYDEMGDPVLDTFAEVQQRWHLWRRRYDLFLRDEPHRDQSESFRQLAKIDQGFLAWHFTLLDARGEEIASVDRTFRGFGREIFTDTGRYYIRFGPRPVDPMDDTPRRPTILRHLTLEERCLVLAMAVNIDFDYFSRHSGGGGWGPLLFFTAWE